MLTTNTLVIFAVFLFKDAAFAEKVDYGEFGAYHLWRKTVCEKKNQSIFDELEACFLKDPPVVVNATLECMVMAVPKVKGNESSFENYACEDPSLFKKFDECYAKYEKDEAFKEKVELASKNYGCYKDVVVKYNLDQLLVYFEKESDEDED